MIERQARRPQRDGILFALGLSGIIAIELLLAPESSATEGEFLYASLFGCSMAVMLSGVFRVTNKQLILSTICLGIGFGLGAMVSFF